MKGMNGMKSAGVCGLWIMVGQCLVSTARGVWESDATLPASSWQLRIFLQVYAPIWRHLAYLDHLKLLVFFAFLLHLSSSCCAVSLIPNILFDHPPRMTGEQLRKVCVTSSFAGAWHELRMVGYRHFSGAESQQSTAATCRSFSRCPHNGSLWWELLESWSDLPWLAGLAASGMLHIWSYMLNLS